MSVEEWEKGSGGGVLFIDVKRGTRSVQAIMTV
jgi:hypothetical protein